MIRRSRSCYILLLGFFALAPAFAGELEKKVDQIFAAFDKPGSPGCALGVVRNGDFVYQRGYGLASLELGVPLSPGSVFYMGSVSKQFTAASVVLAAELGSLTLDDDVRKWIPELPSYGHTITLRHLLHHTSGLRDVLTLLDLAGGHAEDVHPIPEFIDLIARQKALNFEPGSEYLYSNSNYVLLAEVVHRATGKPISQFAEENIFKPLGMTHARFYDDHTLVLPNRVPAYASRPDGSFRVNWSTSFDKVGDGGLMSSVEDLLLWDRNFYDNKLGKGTLLRELQTRGVLASGKPIDYALGLVISQYRGLPIVEHGGALFGYRTEILRFPEAKFSVITLCNLATANPAAKAHQVADLYLAGQFPAAPASKPQSPPALAGADVRPFAGTYRNPQDRSFAVITARDGALVIRNVVLQPVAPNVFADPEGPQYRFEPTAGGGMRLTWTAPDGTTGQLERIPAAQPSAAELAQYAGDYFSDELQATYRVRAQDDRLSVRVGWNEAVELRPTVRDEFRGPFVFAFLRDPGGKVTGFDLFAGRVRNISFARK